MSCKRFTPPTKTNKMNYTNEDIEALAGLATSKNSKDWDLFNQYPADIKLKTMDAIIGIINKSSARIDWGASSGTVTSFLALGLDVEFDIYTKINFITLRKCSKIIDIIEDNIQDAGNPFHLDILPLNPSK